MFQYYNANPHRKKVDDCTVRAISLATNCSWDKAFIELSEFARAQCTMPNDVLYIDEYLERHFEKVCGCRRKNRVTVEEFVIQHPEGIYLITMNGHITCAIDGTIYDTFNPGDRYVWDAYRVDEKERD